MLTHDPKVDDPAITEALRRGASYVGALGSRRTQAKRRERLAESGVPEADLDRVHGPVGLDIGADTPAGDGRLDRGGGHRRAGRAQRAQPGRHHGPHPRNGRRELSDADRERVHRPAAGDDVYRLMLDVERVTPCIPGAEVLGRREDGGYDAKVSMKMGPM